VCLIEPSNFFEEISAFTAAMLFKSVSYLLAGPSFLAGLRDPNHRKGTDPSVRGTTSYYFLSASDG
jgi:hypothetical protein